MQRSAPSPERDRRDGRSSSTLWRPTRPSSSSSRRSTQGTILLTLYEPSLQERLDRIDRTLEQLPSPKARLERLLLVLWRDLSTATGEDYSPKLRKLVQAGVAGG